MTILARSIRQTAVAVSLLISVARPHILSRRADLLRFFPRLRLAWLCGLGVAFGCPTTVSLADSFVRLDYNLTLNNRSRNTVFIELFDDRPLTSTNFLQYVNGGRYDQSLVHRLAKNFVLQGGGYYPKFVPEPAPENISLDPTATVDLDGNPATPNPTVTNEYSNSPHRSNVRGTIAMAKISGDPNSASNQWFVNLVDNSANLDNANGGFAVFAQVIGDGMTLFDAYNSLSITNLNPDANDDGTRDGGPFFTSSTDGVPFLGNNLVVLNKAAQIDYFGNGSTTNIPVAGLNFLNRDAFIDTGATFTGTGGITIGSGRTLGVREGYLLAQPVNNLGTLAPGLQLGSITIGSYQQGATGTLDIQLRNTAVDTDYDRVTVAGAAQLAGTLRVSLLNQFIPAAGNSFVVLSANSISGSFSTVQLPSLAAGLVWNMNASTTNITLTVVAADYNHDGIVNAADYNIWRDTLGKSVTPYSGADGSGNGIIDQADYAIWHDNFGETWGGSSGSGSSLSSGVAAVPEPASFLLLVVTAAMALFLRNRPTRWH